MLFPKTAYQVEHLGTLRCDVIVLAVRDISEGNSTFIFGDKWSRTLRHHGPSYCREPTSGSGLQGTTVLRTVKNRQAVQDSEAEWSFELSRTDKQSRTARHHSPSYCREPTSSPGLRGTTVLHTVENRQALQDSRHHSPSNC